MPDLAEVIPYMRELVGDKQRVFWVLITLIVVLVLAILGLTISSHSRDYAANPLTTYASGCQDLTSQWHTDESGSSGTIKVGRSSSHPPPSCVEFLNFAS